MVTVELPVSREVNDSIWADVLNIFRFMTVGQDKGSYYPLLEIQ